MEKHLNRKFSDVANDHPPGCLWSVLHVVRSYQWQNVKKMKMVPHKRIVSRRLIGGARYSRLKTNTPDTSVSQGSVGAERGDTNIVEMSERNSGDTSGNAHIKELIAEEMSKEQDKKSAHKRVRSFQRTESIHHLDPSDDMLPDEVREDSKSPMTDHHEAGEVREDSKFPTKPSGLPAPCCNGCELCGTLVALKHLSHSELEELGRQLLGNALLQSKLERAKEAISRENTNATDAKESLKDVAFHQSRGLLDALEMLKVDNALLQNTRLDPNYALAQHIQVLQNSNAKRGLTKSETFPIGESSSIKKIKPSKLKPVQKDVNEKAVTVPKHDEESPTPDKLQAYPKSSAGPPVELKKRRFKDFRQKIKNVIKESRKEGHHISMDAIFHKMPYGSKFFKHGKRSNEKDINNSACIAGTSKAKSMKRSQSLHESMDKYSQLFEMSFGGETKQHVSDNSKLASSCEGSTFHSAPKGMDRIFSLPELRSYCLLQYDESGEALSSTTPARVPVDNNTSIESLSSTEKKQESLVAEDDVSVVYKDQTELISDPVGNELATKEETTDELDNLRNTENGSVSLSEQETESAPIADINPMSVQDTYFQEDISIPTKLSVSEGAELEPVEELDSLPSLHNQSAMDSIGEAISTPDLNKMSLHSSHWHTDFRDVQVDKKDETDFNYVRDILKLSGFSVNEGLGTWYSPDQPVDPSLFEDVESCSPLKSDYSEGEVSSSNDHQLLFDIINEALLEIYDRSFTYWPWPLSCNCHIRPMPTGYHVLEEVWGIISWYLNSQPEFEPMDYLVVRDLSKNDGWMNLQLDSECVGLELEEMILDDLLDELIYE